MTAPVKLPRRLPDREPERSDPPSERDWLRSAIQHCEHHGVAEQDDPHDASFASFSRHGRELGEPPSRDERLAGWLPEHLRRVPLAELRRMLDALESPTEDADP